MMEAGYSANYGPEGVGWRKAEPGELDMNGNQAKYAYLRPVDQKQNDNWFQMEPYYETSEFIASFANNDLNRKEGFGGAETASKYLQYSALAKRVPFLYHPMDIVDELTQLKNALQNGTTGEVNVWRDRFVTGELDPNSDSDWQSYLDVLNQVGVDRYVELFQQSYDAYLSVAGN